MEKLHPLSVAMAMAGQNQRQTANSAGISEVTISHIINGKVRPLVETRDQIEKVLGMAVNWQKTYDIGRVNYQPRKRTLTTTKNQI